MAIRCRLVTVRDTRAWLPVLPQPEVAEQWKIELHPESAAGQRAVVIPSVAALFGVRMPRERPAFRRDEFPVEQIFPPAVIDRLRQDFHLMCFIHSSSPLALMSHSLRTLIASARFIDEM